MTINFTNQLSKLIDSVRGELREEQVLPLITILLYVKVKDVESINALKRMGLANQKTALLELIAAYPEVEEHSALSAIDFAHNEALSMLISFVADIDDINIAVQTIRTAFANSRFATEYGSNSNEVELLLGLVKPQKKDTFLDPAGGIGNVLSALSVQQAELQEINSDSAIICQLLASLEQKEVTVFKGNSLVQPAFKKASADYVVMTPPLGLRFGREQIDKIKSAPYLLPQESQTSIPMTAGDSLWLQLALWALSDTGKGYVFLPRGWLFRGGYDAQVREYFVENELVEAVVQLPSKFFSHTAVAPVLLILNKAKEKGSPVRFIDAEATQNDAGLDYHLSSDYIAEIVRLITATEIDDPRVVEKYAPDIREQDMILAVNRYITPSTHIEDINFEAESAKLKQLESAYAEAKRQLSALLDN
ncbi:N-6 DNA methylase [Aliidiomarina halalkaliphila]|uniref:site-specific DNA-methyltransferase (adenine-specific) n=1 Tax=Aliidiomarina halalkaliphila TaxID=2593535 RepID=A0A552WZF7_9GAMM|nr:N-6 DNA methylase [Aliidiomarina halalkaliphila]TRW48065.1 N-6 DNA methylase [Aliidiomarina halalkaliphila]